MTHLEYLNCCALIRLYTRCTTGRFGRTTCIWEADTTSSDCEQPDITLPVAGKTTRYTSNFLMYSLCWDRAVTVTSDCVVTDHADLFIYYYTVALVEDHLCSVTSNMI